MEFKNLVKNLIRELFYPTSLKRFLFFFLSDILIITFSLYLSFLLRFDYTLDAKYKILFIEVLPFFILIKLSAFGFFRMYKISWRFVGLNELFNIVNALVVSESILMSWILIPLPSFLKFLNSFNFEGFPRSIFLIDAALSIILLSGLRISKRVFLEVIRERGYRNTGKRTIIIGSGNTGEMILRDMSRQAFSEFYPVGLLDDDRNKIGTYLHGVKVIGPTDALKEAVSRYGVETIIIAIPSLNYKTLRRIYNSAKESDIHTIKIVPRIYDFHRPDINLKNLEEIRIEDLIGREVVEVDYGEIEGFLKGRVVFITGAGGSIGSEITMQICGFHPERIILFDIDETELHNLRLKLNRIFPHLVGRIHFITGDVRDEGRVNEIFERFHPQIVFHSAAYKHVPMMEYNPKEAVKVNMFGTYNVIKASASYGANRFILISTDKAVRPTSIMGATKRMAEYICKAFNNYRGTEFVSVRFGNVFGSRGSVLPLFLEQIKYGGPLTVTHRDMRRYFMTIPEAVALVLQASVIGEGGEILVLDMGDPVKIVELAEELIRIHGLEPYRDIDIEYIGLRPGEKLFEEILTAEEGTVASKHKKIFIAKNSERYSIDEIEKMLKEFDTLIRELPIGEEGKIKDLLKKYVKYFDDD